MDKTVSNTALKVKYAAVGDNPPPGEHEEGGGYAAKAEPKDDRDPEMGWRRL